MGTIEQLIRTAQLSNHLREHVVDELGLFFIDFVEEYVGEVLQLHARVFEEDGDVAHFSLDLDHIVEDEMGQDYHRGLADVGVGVVQVLIQVATVRLHQVGEPVQQVAHRYDDVVLYDRVHVGFDERGEEGAHVLAAILLAYAHELAEGEHGHSLQLTSPFGVLDDVFDYTQPFGNERVLRDGVG